MKALFFIDSYERWGITLESINSVIRYCREHKKSMTIEVVANSIAVMGLVRSVAQQSGWYNIMQSMHEWGVMFAACRDALLKYNSENALLCEFTVIVPSGTAEAIIRQAEGYSFIMA